MNRLTGFAGVLVVGFFAAGDAHAWKLGTHLWLAEQLRTELHPDRPGLTIAPLPGTFRVPAPVRDAIWTNAGSFQLGVLGPDLYPDMIAPQMTTHPGWEEPDGAEKQALAIVPNTLAFLRRPMLEQSRWYTDDWLAHVRREAKTPAEIGFAYGYLIHAAMDTWAHSYVNLYAGDVFSLLDEQEVELRHMAIETFVSRLHSQFVGDPAARASASAASRVVRPPADALTDLTAPVDFVRRTLVLHPKVASQYAKAAATLYLWAMYTYWTEVRDLDTRLEPIRAQVVAAYSAANAALNGAQSTLNAAQSAYNSAVALASDAYQAFKGAEQKALDAAAALERAEKDILEMFPTIDQFAASLLDYAPPPLRQAYYSAKDTLNAAKGALNSARSLYDSRVQVRDQRRQAVENALAKVNLETAARSALASAQQQTLQVIDSAAAGWRINIERAVDAYIRAWQETGKELVRPHARRFSYQADPTEPLMQWVKCWGPTFGLPATAALAGVCVETRASYLALTQNLRVLAQNQFIQEPLRTQIENTESAARHMSTEFLANVMAPTLSRAIRIDNGRIEGYARSVVNLQEKETLLMSQLDDEFDDDTSGKRLLRFDKPSGRMSTMLFQDVGLTPRQPQENLGLAELKSFRALQNSLTLARLTLLDGAGLNLLGAAASGTRGPGVPGRALAQYAGTAPAGEVLIGALRSIDGDHQWQKFAPQLPRDGGRPGGAVRQFGYDATDAGKTGLLLWQDPGLRSLVFNRIFAGPIAPGLLAAASPQALPAGIAPCGLDPFPPSSQPCGIVSVSK